MNIDAVAAATVAEIQRLAPVAWKGWTDDEKKIVTDAAKDGAALLVKKLEGTDVSKELAVVNATLANVRAAALGTASRILWDALFNTVVKAAGALRVIPV